MFRIRRVPDDAMPANAAAIRQVQEILRAQFPLIGNSEVDSLPAKLRDPLHHRFRAILYVAEDAAERVRGFALVQHAPDLGFCLLDFLATSPRGGGRGIGGALYEQARASAATLDVVGIFMECLPDDPALSPDPAVRRQNVSRLRFYERYGARPIAGTAYETPVREGDTDPPYLVFDPLGREGGLPRRRAQRIVRAILERKYGDLCPPEYIDRVVDSFREDPVRLRAPRYVRDSAAAAAPQAEAQRIPLIMNAQHEIHHVADRGYVEAPIRIRAILRDLEKTGLFETVPSRRFPDMHIVAVHDAGYVDYLRRACASVEPKSSTYPYVFPIRNKARPPKELSLRAGYYCIDTFTPLNRAAFTAARAAVDCALTAAERVLGGDRLAYALVRPPGHHAERRAFGGFCYFNNAAIAAQYLSRFGRVAVLDIDYHHGNGTQDIFYDRRDVLTVSIHGHPSFAYPYFSGFREEGGLGAGAGYNLNIPLPETLTPAQYRDALGTALRRIRRFAPDFLVLATGFDTASGDPTGSWQNRAADFAEMGRILGAAGHATVVVQEGGYRTRTIGTNARHFFEGLWRGVGEAGPAARRRTGAPARPAAIEYREEVRASDGEAVRALVAQTGVFSTAEVAIAEELVTERLARGGDSGYEFVVAEQDGRVVGYTCYGPIPGTVGRYDLYWIAVHPDHQKTGLGGRLLAETERRIAAAGGARIYIDTSSGEAYAATRRFYQRNGYRKLVELADFYRPGDGKVLFLKILREEPES